MKRIKPTILILLAHYLPGYKCGGPIRAIANLVDHLGDEFDFKIITSDRDMLDSEPFPGVQIDKWNTVGNAAVFYGSPDQLCFRNLARLVSETPHDLLYINSFFSDRFSIFPLLARRLGILPKKPVVLAPRGEFSRGALSIKRVKKYAFLSATKLLGLHRDLSWQASSAYEEEDIRSAMGNIAQKIMVAPDLLPKRKPSVLKPDTLSGDDSVNALRIVFFSRISPMKNLGYAIEVLKLVAVPVEFDIYGVIDNQVYWESCKAQMACLPGNIKVTYKGVLEHSKVHATLTEYDLFFFPTRGENFGHVIFEALAAGVPVLISDQTPWRDLEEKGVGWVRPLDEKDGFVRVITEFSRWNKGLRKLQRFQAKDYAMKRATEDESVGANRELFLGAILDTQG